MKSFKRLIKPYPHLFALFLVMMAAIAIVQLGAPLITGIAIVALWQLSQFAMSKRRAVCFIGALTEEQIKEFSNIMKTFGEHTDALKEMKELAKMEGGIAAIRGLPALLKEEKKRNDDLAGELKKFKRQNLLRPNETGVRWVKGVPFVTDECALAFAGMYIVSAHVKGKWSKSLGSEEETLAKARQWLGIEQRAGSDLSVADIPMPTIYMPQVVELVFAYGQARQFSTIFPLGAGSVKLPQLSAGEDTFGFLGVGTAGNAQNIAKKEVQAALVTFTANKCGGIIAIPTEIEEDTFIPLGQFLARYIARQFAKLEDNTLFNGDGTGTYANITGVGKYCVNNNAYLSVLANGKTKPSDAQLQDFRSMRPKVNAAILANMAANGQTNAAYYMHPTMEALLVTFNTIGAPLVYRPAQGNQPAMLDGFPIRWIGVSQAYGTVAAPGAYLAFFGDLSYWYLGERGAPRVEISRDVYFATDELAMRALERIDVEAMAPDAMATLQTAAQ